MLSFKILQIEPSITTPFQTIVALYTSETKKVHQGSLLNWQVAPNWLQKIIPMPLDKKLLNKLASMAHKL